MKNQARILVVDDNRSLVRIVEGILQRMGYEIITAYDGVEALDQARLKKPDLIILDIVMPNMDGYEAARRLQSDPATARIPILMLTVKGHVEEDPTPDTLREWQEKVRERMAGFDAGAVEFMSKPVTAKELVNKVKTVLWMSRVKGRRQGSDDQWVD
jgi:CheY-like chemotaxis protein